MSKSTLRVGQELHSDSIVYRIDAILGQGSFGVTYKVTAFTVLKGKLGEELIAASTPKAVKEFFMKEINERDESGSITGMSEGSISYNYARKFRREAENLAGMRHPNIVKVIDFIDANNTYYYVMDYIEGENLNDWLKHHRPDEKEAVDIIMKAAEALRYMHEERHMLHLDLKPGNIMRRSSDGHIFLIDFGLSKHYSDDGQPDTSTTVGLGTEGYAPIEQGKKTSAQNALRPTIDVYALGATLFKLLTGETPPPASDVLEDEDLLPGILQKHGVSPELQGIIVRSMMPSAKKRTQSIAAFMTEIKTKCVYQAETGTSGETDSETTVFEEKPAPTPAPDAKPTPTPVPSPKPSPLKKYGIFVAGLLAGLLVFWLWPKDPQPVNPIEPKIQETTQPQSAVSTTVTNSASSQSQTFTVAGVSFKMVKVEGASTGTFYIGETEVTQALWQAVMGNNPSYFKGSNRPVESVSWNDCDDFISQLNIKTGKTFRLPKESEWEYAAKGGNKSRGYSWSGCNSEDELEQYAWYDKNAYYCGSSSGNSSHPDYGTHNVKSKRPNELGLYDMSGNVWEWCQDLSGAHRVNRGGGWNYNARYCRVSYRSYDTHNFRDYNLGLRLAL